MVVSNTTFTGNITNSGTITPGGIIVENASTINGGIVDNGGTITGGIIVADSKSTIDRGVEVTGIVIENPQVRRWHQERRHNSGFPQVFMFVMSRVSRAASATAARSILILLLALSRISRTASATAARWLGGVYVGSVANFTGGISNTGEIANGFLWMRISRGHQQR